MTAELKHFERLCEEAKFLLDSDRAESSLTLSVIALEHVGKVYLHRWGMQGAGNHQKKQNVAASLALASLFMEGLEKAGLDLVHVSQLTPQQAQFSQWSVVRRSSIA